MGELVKIVGIIAAAVAFVSAVWWGFYLIWNAIVPVKFGGPELSFWESVGVLLLVSFAANMFRGRNS